MKYLKLIGIVLIILVIGLVITYQFLPVNPTIRLPFEKYEGEVDLDKINLPAGFSIDVWADSVDNARSMVLSPSGILYVGTRSKGNVYALQDKNGDGRADQRWTIYQDGNMPNGVAFYKGDLYVAEVNRILKFTKIEEHLADPKGPEIVYDQYPTETHHGWKYISFGPDGKLYVPVGAPCNICESENEIFASLTRLASDGSSLEIVHRGIRNTVGFDWHPDTKELWFTDNGRDWMGDNQPECELNHATQDNLHFGYPYCHQGNLEDPEYGDQRKCEEFSAPVALLGPHTAPLGMEFYLGNHFPEEYHKQIFVTRHGSWNRKEKIGYDLVLVNIDKKGKVKEVKDFATGWLSDNKDDVWGRPVDIEMLADGTLLVSDDYANLIYRIYYQDVKN